MKTVRSALFPLAGIFFLLSSCTQTVSFDLEIPESTPQRVVCGKTTAMLKTQKIPLRFWHFNGEQQTAIASFFEQQGDAALEVTFSVKRAKSARAHDSVSSLGFLYEDDFAGVKRLRRERETKAQVTADFDSLAATGKPFTIVLSMNREKALLGSLPAGFSVASAERYTILAARIVPACVGFDYTRQNPLYAFAPNGGLLVPYATTFDTSGVSLAFAATNTASTLMPTLTVTTVAGGDVSAVIGSERFLLRQGKAATSDSPFHTIPIPCAALKSPFSQFSITQNPQYVASALVQAASRDLLAVSAKYARAVLKPLLVDPGLIMEWRSSQWRSRDSELFAWDRFPSVLIFDTATYSVQDDFFRRLAFFAEKAGYRGTLQPDSFLEHQHGYNAHDYRAETLAAFFELARKTNFPLNERELLLKEILSVNGIIRFAADGGVIPGEGAVISISQESPVYLRWTFIAHEGWHGLFFTDSDFQNTVASLYYTMDKKALRALLTYFAVTPTLNYDCTDDYLMKNEFMAYMLQRPLSQVREYYVNLASRSHAQTKMKEEADYILATNAEGYVSAATMLDQYVSDRWNLAAGRVWLVNRQAN